MKHPIDPKVDCVFKALLGAEQNRRLLIHFLNAILGDELTAPLVEVEILNPYNEREFLDDKLSIVDVKARDAGGRLYQIEIQLLNVADLPARILYGWADLYSAQLQDGDGYDQLKPTYSIWLLGQALRPTLPEVVHRFRLRDDQGRSLLEHGGIWLLELSKFAAEVVETERDRWLKFFVEGARLDAEHPAGVDGHRGDAASDEHLKNLFREDARLSPVSGAAELWASAAEYSEPPERLTRPSRTGTGGGRAGARGERARAGREGSGPGRNRAAESPAPELARAPWTACGFA